MLDGGPGGIPPTTVPFLPQAHPQLFLVFCAVRSELPPVLLWVHLIP